jgi:hypothetical protein
MGTIFSPLVGNQVGSGMALIFIIFGILGAVGGLAGYLIPAVRNVEDIMPDHDQDAAAFADSHENPAEAESASA